MFLHLEYLTAREPFPFEEFLLTAVPNDFNIINTTFPTGEEIDYFKKFHLCEYDEPGCCSCDEDCMQTKSCCIDKLWNISNPIPLNKYLKDFRQTVEQSKTKACLPAIAYKSVFDFKSSYYNMINSCIDGFDTEISSKCFDDSTLEPLERVPVFGSDGELYKNSYCARCNDIQNFHTANYTILCFQRSDNVSQTDGKVSTKSAKETLANFTGCQVSVEKQFNKTSMLNECDENKLIRTCPSSDSESMCQFYQAEVGNYHNIHCYACNGEDLRNVLFPGIKCHGKKPGGFFSWSLTINFGGGETQVAMNEFRGANIKESFSVCESGEIFSLFDGTCKPFTCGVGFEKDGTNCVKIPDSEVLISNPDFSRCLESQEMYLYMELINNSSNLTFIVELFEQDFNTSNETFKISYQNHNVTIYQRLLPITTIQNFSTILMKNSLHTWRFVSRYILSQTDSSSVHQSFILHLSDQFNGGKLCASAQRIETTEANFTSNCSFVTNKTLHPYSTINLLKSFSKDAVNEEIYSCKQFHLYSECRREIIFDESFQVLANHSIQVRNTVSKDTIIYNVDQYQPIENGISICENPEKIESYKWLETINKIKYYISIIGTIISIFCHIFYIITYALFKALRNRGSLNVLAIVCALLLSDLLYLIAINVNEDFNACKTIAIILHWSLLVVCMWSIIIAADITSSFLKNTVKPSANYHHQFIKYLILSIIPSSIIILISVALNETQTISFGYGRNGVCWFGFFYPLLVSYMIPALIGYLFSVVCLCFIVYYLYRHEKQNARALKGSDRKDIRLSRIALKLVIVLGISEIIGVIQIYSLALSENEQKFNAAFSLIYDFSRSFRGMMICLIYLANKMTFALYKSLFRTPPNKEHSKKTTTSYLTTNSCQSTPDVSVKLTHLKKSSFD